MLCGYGAAIATHMIDFEAVKQAPIFALPHFTTAKFDINAIMIMLPVLW